MSVGLFILCRDEKAHRWMCVPVPFYETKYFFLLFFDKRITKKCYLSEVTLFCVMDTANVQQVNVKENALFCTKCSKGEY